MNPQQIIQNESPRLNKQNVDDVKQSQRRLSLLSNIFENALSSNKISHEDEIDSDYWEDWQRQDKKLQLIKILSQYLSFNRQNGQLGHTNSVLLDNSSNQDIELFLPGYMRVKIRNLIGIDIGVQQTRVNALIQFSINYSRLPRLLVDYLKEKLVMRFSKKNSILLKQTQEIDLSIKVIQNDALKIISFTINLPLTFHFQPYYPFKSFNLDASIWLSPFQKINNLLTITIQDLQVRWDDLICDFKNFYSDEQFQQVQNYFKHIKKYDGHIRKLIVKVNLMDLIEPQLISKKNLSKQRKQCDKRRMSLKSQMQQKYKLMAGIYLDLQSQSYNSPMSQFKFNKPFIQSQFRIYQLKKELNQLSKMTITPNKLDYEQEHLSGQYAIVTSQFNVKFSCYKYLKLKRKQQTQLKINEYIASLKGNRGHQNKIESHQRIIVEKILLKQRTSAELTQSPEKEDPLKMSSENFMVTNNDLVNKQKSKIKKSHSFIDQKKLIESVAQQIKRKTQVTKNFQYAHFELPIYKHPFVPLAIVFFPLWIIAAINLIIYFEPRNLDSRLSNIATLLISYVAYFPIFRQQIPEYRYLLLAQILALLQILCSLLTILHSLQQSDSQERLSINQVGPLFWISFSITTFNIIIVLIGYIVHKLIIQRQYRCKKHIRRNKKIQINSLRHIIWNNFECDFAYLKRGNLVLFESCPSYSQYIKTNYPQYKLRN